MITDVHAHCIPQAFRDWLARRGPDLAVRVVELASGIGVDLAGQVTTGPQFGLASLTDMTARIEQMDRAGIERQVLAGWVDLTGYELDGLAAEEYARAHNSALAEEASRVPERFLALGTVPLQDPGLAIRALDHAVNVLGMKGIQIATTVRGRFLDQVDGLDGVLAAAQDLGVFVLLHPMRPLSGLDLTRYGLDNAVGRPVETSVALSGLIMSGALERHPGLILCAVHGGGFTPYQIGRLDRAFATAPDVAGARISRPPSDYLRMVYADTVLHDGRALSHLVSVIGADRVLLGTDHPFPMGDPDPLGLVRSAPGLTDDDVAAITGGNATAIFG